MKLDDVVNHAVELIADDPEINKYCESIARKHAGVGIHTLEELEEKDPVRYNLYWSVYASTIMRICVSVAEKQTRYRD